MDANFVRRGLKCGKSKLRYNVRFPDAAWIGAASSPKFIRSYPKSSIGRYRVELQVNREFLTKHNLRTPADLVRLAEIARSQIRFLDVDWIALSTHIRRHFPRYPEILLRKAREQEGVITELLQFLRCIGVTNPTRFLVPMSINRTVSDALRLWTRRWKADGNV